MYHEEIMDIKGVWDRARAAKKKKEKKKKKKRKPASHHRWKGQRKEIHSCKPRRKRSQVPG